MLIFDRTLTERDVRQRVYNDRGENFPREASLRIYIYIYIRVYISICWPRENPTNLPGERQYNRTRDTRSINALPDPMIAYYNWHD